MLQIAVLEILPKIEASRCEAVSLYSRSTCAQWVRGDLRPVLWP